MKPHEIEFIKAVKLNDVLSVNMLINKYPDICLCLD